ncbi:hypothetical protein AX16_000561 [Volvariella volvacea WC 439]|nr:hypothetical protein AX16_000561 [Volvariella volvacea WC 439]
MPAERAGYTAVVYVVDTSPSMGKMREVTIETPEGEEQTVEMTNLEWALQFVKMKIQEMIYHGRKTDQCGVILFGSEETDNLVHDKDGGYDHVQEYIPIAQPNAGTLAKLDAIRPSTVSGDPIDGLIVAMETQATYLLKKQTWTRKIVIITDGGSPIELEDWEAVVTKLDTYNIILTIVGVDFDDEEYPFVEENKPHIKKTNETFYHHFISTFNKAKPGNGVVGTCAFALQEASRPDIKETKSALMATVLRIGDTTAHWEEAIEIDIETCKCTAIARPKSFKAFSLRENDADGMDIDEDTRKDVYAQLKRRTEYYIDRSEENEEDEEDVKREEDTEEDMEALQKRLKEKEAFMEKVEKEELTRGFKYGTTYVPCPDGQFPHLPTTKGIEIWGFFPRSNFRRELAMGEIQYIWAKRGVPQQQVALSSIVQAMDEKGTVAIARWVTKDGMDPKMGILWPILFENVDCLLWAQMPFADDIRKYTFASLTRLVNKKGEVLTEHPYLPTEAQQEAMDNFVDAMDLMTAGEKDEEGNRTPWFETTYSYNPSIHRIKQAQFHCAIVSDLEANPLPPPHPELTKYFEPPRKVLKRAREALEECKTAFKVKEVPKKAPRARKDGHEHATEEDENLLLLDRKASATQSTQQSQTLKTQSQVVNSRNPSASPRKDKEKEKEFAARARAATDQKGKAKAAENDSATESDTEDDEDEDIVMVEAPSVQTSQQKQREAYKYEEDDDEILLDKVPSSSRTGTRKSSTRSVTPQVDPGRAPGRIVGMAYPLKDFENNLKRGDVVSKAVEDLGWVLKEIVLRPFASRRYDECLECLRKMRDVCLKEDEIDAWNSFMQDLHSSCLSKPGNIEFWERLKKEGKSLSLISEREARKYGGVSSVTEVQAQQFLS